MKTQSRAQPLTPRTAKPSTQSLPQVRRGISEDKLTFPRASTSLMMEEMKTLRSTILSKLPNHKTQNGVGLNTWRTTDFKNNKTNLLGRLLGSKPSPLTRRLQLLVVSLDNDCLSSYRSLPQTRVRLGAGQAETFR